MTKRQIQAMIQVLVRQGYLRQEGLRYPVLAITDAGREIMHNRAVARLGSWQPAPPRQPRREPLVARAPISEHAMEEHAELREALRAWRLPQSQGDGRSALHAFLGPYAR